MRRIQIQTRTSQLLITHINQGTNHLVYHQGDLFSSHHSSIFSDPLTVIIGFLVTCQGGIFNVHHSSIFSDLSPVILAFSVTRQGILFSETLG
jgi:hypothetical protein